MVDAIGEPDVFCIEHKVVPVGAAAFALIVFDDFVNGMSDGEVVAVVHVVHDVAPGQSGLGEVIDQLFLLQAEFVKIGDAIMQHPFIGEAVNDPLKALFFFCLCLGILMLFLFGRRVTAGEGQQASEKRCHKNPFFQHEKGVYLINFPV